jgi:hypothetical protein
MEKQMPDYSKGSVSLTETKVFQDWIAAKGHRWPPFNLTERDSLVCQFQREGMEEYRRTHSGEGKP